MTDTAIKIEGISKLYQLGTVSTQTMYGDIHRWWARVRGKEDPFMKVGTTNTLNKRDGDYVWALKDINLEIKQGDVVGIIGKNGAGKSTLLKILSRVTAPTTGQITVNGRIASLLEVGTGFHPELTGRENIFLNGAILGMTKAEIRSKFDEIVDFSGVEKYIDTPVKRYSSGMYVRLAFAVAAHLEPEILIVDEVLAVGDAEFQKKALGKMQDVSKGQGRTVLFVSHNMTAIDNLCSNVIVLKDGYIDYIGDVKNSINRYLTNNDSVQQGASAINYVDEDFSLISVDISQGDKMCVFNTQMPISILFKYEVKRDIYGLRIGFDLVDSKTGVILFRTFHDDASEEAEKMNKGLYVSQAIIPENFLKEATYSVNICIGIHCVRWILQEYFFMQIDVKNLGGINKNYADFRPGVIMPIINWVNNEF